MPARRSIFLIASFAAILAVGGLSEFEVYRNARDAQVRTIALHNKDMETQDALDSIRTSVYLTAILTRDFRLELDTPNKQEFQMRFQTLRAGTKKPFEILQGRVVDESQRVTLQQLRGELDEYLRNTEEMMKWGPAGKRTLAMELLRQRARQRSDILALIQRIEQLNAQNSARQAEEMEKADKDFRSSLVWIASTALLFGLGISVVTLTRMLSLERQSRAAESELRSLGVELRTAQERERRNLSRELHDQVGQMLTGVRMELACAARLNTCGDAELALRLERAKNEVEQTLGIVRNIAMLLRPSMLDDLGLAPALVWLGKQVAENSGIEIHADVDPRLDTLPDSHRTCLYRVMQEALTNVARHSGARKAEMRAGGGPDWVRAVVSDDGRGFQYTSDRKKGLGLLGMEERVRELGGSLRVQSSPGRGTSVEISLPNPSQQEKKDDQDSDRRRSWDRADGAEASAGTPGRHSSSG
ncbi:MAG: MCP four helix bundle domain-containing protein [Candidatus Solibacter usitatus]|nr:MCP four helix bundle domain-containing protein [Candidatus Solibacter usitatus]